MKGIGSGKLFKREIEVIQEIQSKSHSDTTLKLDLSKQFSEECDQVNLDEFFQMAKIICENCQNVQLSNHQGEFDESDSSESSDDCHSSLYPTLVSEHED